MLADAGLRKQQRQGSNGAGVKTKNSLSTGILKPLPAKPGQSILAAGPSFVYLFPAKPVMLPLISAT